jgi:hypothetical protein
VGLDDTSLFVSRLGQMSLLTMRGLDDSTQASHGVAGYILLVTRLEEGGSLQNTKTADEGRVVAVGANTEVISDDRLALGTTPTHVEEAW